MIFDNITVTNIEDVFVVSSPKGRFAKIENRSCYGLSFCEYGQITYTHNQDHVVSDKNSAILLPQGQTYTLSGDKNGSFPVIDFTCTEHLCDTIIALPVQNTALYVESFKNLMSLLLFDGNKSEMMSVFYHLLHLLSLESAACKTLKPALEYIEKNYQHSDISNEFLAKQCNISEIYFRNLFRKHYNTTPHQFITDLRIKKAEQLLSEGKFKVYAISEKCGFTNQYHFSRIFKKKVGLTPSEYMKFNRNIKI